MLERDRVAGGDDARIAGPHDLVDGDAVRDIEPGLGGDLDIRHHADADDHRIGGDALAVERLDGNRRRRPRRSPP